jgi:hypothetical protein
LNMTPRQFQALHERFLDREEREIERVGLLAMLYANNHRSDARRNRPFTIDEFAPSRHGPRPAAPAFVSNKCRECGIREGFGHLPECVTGQSIVQANLANVWAVFSSEDDARRKLAELTN